MRKQLFITIILSAFCLFSSFDLLAAKISGTVVDEKNEPLAGVTVVIKSLQKGTQTDADGKYEIDGVDDGTYEVLFSLITFKKSLQTVTILKGKDEELNATLKEEGRNLTEVTVKSTKLSNTENAVIMEMRKSNSMVSAISAQQISKTMDRNAADVVKRVPGVTIMDDKFIMVRGLYDRYNSVWLNDVGAPSSEVDKRAFSFDVIPSGQIDRIIIAKTPAPELPGDFAGGMVKLYTTSIPDKNTYTIGYQISSREYSTGTDFNYTPKSKTDWLGYDDGSRSMPSAVPGAPSLVPSSSGLLHSNDPDINSITKSFKNTWGLQTKKQAPDTRLNFSASNIFKIKKVRIGNTFAVNYTNTSTNFKRERWEYDSTDLQKHFNDVLSVNNVNSAILENVAAAWGNNKIEFKNLYNQSGRSAVTVRNNAYDTNIVARDERQYNESYESRAIYSTQLNGTHKSSDDTRKYNWTLGYTDLFRNMPDLRRISYSKIQGTPDSQYAAGITTYGDFVYGGGRVYSQLYEKSYCFSHQYTQKIRIKNYEFEANLGNYLEYKSRSYSLRSFAYSLIVDNQTKLGYKRLPLDQIFSDQYLGDNGFKMQEKTNDFDHYDANNKLIASYLSVKLPFLNDKLQVYGGVRHEYNIYSLTAIVNIAELTPVIKTEYFLPSLNVSYNLTDKQLVRLAYGKTLNRPEFKENSPFFFYDLENRWGVKGALFPTVVSKALTGREDVGDTLKVSEIQNIDARWEWYPSAGEVIQVGLFYKSFTNPIQQVITVGGGDSREFTYANLQKATCYGLEIDVRKNLMFLDDAFKSNFFKNFSFVGNAAFIKSEVTAQPALNIPASPLQGQSPYMFNAGLYFQNDKTGLQGSLLYNVFGPRIYLLGSVTQQAGSIWDLPYNMVDFVVSKRLYKFIDISFGVQNLLNATIKQAQDVNYDAKIDTKFSDTQNADRQFTSYKPGRYFTFGVKLKF
ncbi:MAG: hypothetical protein BGO70_10470 [Bacteroidetes bacterium 43-93]|nr:TonB-dependent receptor [Bacteroidota bacterium]OJW95542.1 MAG: hypothetical protein BGO70_10470 [Bacteroidetes bacterium 43-93]